MRTIGTVLAALLLVGACSSDPTPREPNGSATTPGSSAPPTAAPTVPPMPAQAGEDSPEGAAAFVKHWVDVFNYAAATGDVDELSRLSSPECKGCQNYIKLYRDTYAAGGYFKGGDWTLGELEMKIRERESYVTTTVMVPPSRYRETASTREKRDPGERPVVSFGMARTDVSWQITQFGKGKTV